MWFGISNACGVWLNLVGQSREADEEHDEDCAEEIVRETARLL